MSNKQIKNKFADKLSKQLKKSGYDMDERARHWDAKLQELEHQRQEYIRQGLIKEGYLDNAGEDDGPVAQSIIRRILMQRTDLLAKYGPEVVMQAVDNVADWVGDVDEIGTSDVSNWVRQVEQDLESYNRPQMSAEAVEKNVQDIVKMDVPFLLRALEYAREDAKTDVDLHVVVDRMIQAAVDGDTLDMSDYVSVFGEPDVDMMHENAETLNIGDPVVITGRGVRFSGATGEIAEFGKDKLFVIVNLYNHGKRAFHSSDVSYNDYADSDQEDADNYDHDADRRNWVPEQQNKIGETTMSNKKNISEGVLDDTDEDGWMAKSQLYKTAKYAIGLHGMIQDTDNLEPWIQAKITRASEDLSAVKHYLEYMALNPHHHHTTVPAAADAMSEGGHTQTALDLNPSMRRAGDRPGVVDRIKSGARRVANMIAPDDEELIRDLQKKSGVPVTGRRPGVKESQIEERAKNPYAVGMSQAMKTTGDRPPLKKSTIKKAHKIADKVAKSESTTEQLEQQANDFYTSIKSKINEK